MYFNFFALFSYTWQQTLITYSEARKAIIHHYAELV